MDWVEGIARWGRERQLLALIAGALCALECSEALWQAGDDEDHDRFRLERAFEANRARLRAARELVTCRCDEHARALDARGSPSDLALGVGPLTALTLAEIQGTRMGVIAVWCEHLLRTNVTEEAVRTAVREAIRPW